MCGCFSISRSAGRVASSLRWARSRNFRISFGSVGTVVLGTLVVGTFLPPRAALVLVEPRGQQRGSGCQVGCFAQCLEFRIEGVQLNFLPIPGLPLGFSIGPFQGVHLGQQRGGLPGANVLANDAAVDLPRAGVIAAALLPAHDSVTSAAFAPLAVRPPAGVGPPDPA